MMRTVEVLLVIFILLGAFTITAQLAVLPSPQRLFGTNLGELSESTLQAVNQNNHLAEVVFKSASDPAWGELERALTASLPANLDFNLSVFNIRKSPNGTVTYHLDTSLSNSDAGIRTTSASSSCLVTSRNVTQAITRERIGERSGRPITLYILNCEDANGWWITGYSGQSLALDLYSLLSPYFVTTILVNNTNQFERLLNGVNLTGENVRDAVMINTFGEAVPIPSSYADQYPSDNYAEYCYVLGQKVNQLNWTWVSIVGYPLYYVSNTAEFGGSHNSWGIYGMIQVGQAGINAFLQGIDNPYSDSYSYDSSGITGSPGVVHLTSTALELVNYYGIYPAPYQTSTRALSSSILTDYNLDVRPSDYVFEPVDGWIAGATYSHKADGEPHGALTAIGLTRTPDIRITALALLQYYRPAIYRSEFGALGTTRLVVLQLSQQGEA